MKMDSGAETCAVVQAFMPKMDSGFRRNDGARSALMAEYSRLRFHVGRIPSMD